uniref:Uncharacterized protein n=1 Tax=Fagus sylvatica TaxID=28930 RepID=A0A2N9G4P2_FAGSY
MAGWSEEAVSSELRERLDRWSEGLRAGDERLEWPTDRWSEDWLAGWQLLEAERSEKSRGERNEDLELGVKLFKSVLYNPFRSGRNGRKISYRHANRYESPLCSTSAKISACSGPFRPVSARFGR